MACLRASTACLGQDKDVVGIRPGHILSVLQQQKATLLNFPPPSIAPPRASLQLLSFGSTQPPAGGGGRGHAANLLKGKWTWMSGGGASSFPPVSIGSWVLFFSNFLPFHLLFLRSPRRSASLSVSSAYFLSGVFILTFTPSSWRLFNGRHGRSLGSIREPAPKPEWE